MAMKDLRFKVGEREFLIPADASGNYQKASEMTDELLEKGDKPEQGVWLPGGVFGEEIILISQLHDLGVIPENFFELPVISGSFWYQWEKNLHGINDNPKQEWLAFGKPQANGRQNFIYVDPTQEQRIYFTNWSRIR
jgi:hypothetical protein